MKQITDFDITDGLSQTERFSSYLDPEYFKIDDRPEEHFLVYTILLSRIFNYYNHDNLIEGDWRDFFDSDIEVLVTLMSTTKLKETIRKFDRIISKFNECEEDDEFVFVLNMAFTDLFTIFDLLNPYRAKVKMSNKHTDRTESMISIFDSLREEITSSIKMYEDASKKFPDILKLPIPSIEQDDKKLLPAEDKNLFTIEDKKVQISTVTSWFDDIFSKLRVKFSNLISAANTIEKNRSKGDVYDPHIGLFVTFLKLYQYLQDKMNWINTRHLNYYYNEVIGIRYKQPVPDKMHIVLQAAPIQKRVVLEAGEGVFAEAPVTREIIPYKLAQDTIITQTQIKELKTGFIGQQKQFQPGDGNYDQVKEFRLYVADNPVPKPAEFEKTKNNYKPWPLLGEEQSKLIPSERTMKNASIGLIVSSPLLYARDGDREIEVKFYLTQVSFKDLQDYINNFSWATASEEGFQNKALVTHNLFDQSFHVRITGEKGWVQIKTYSINFLQKASEKYIELKFILNALEPAIDVYNSAIHGSNYNISTPALELILNNSLFHHPFSFYRAIKVERINIKLNVTDSRDIRLQNSFGPISTTVPFQLFGPIPTVGSYLDIKNSNVFNRFTSKCSIRLQWFNLPKEPGGFETYFKDYDTGFKNGSYQVAISSLQTAKQVADPGLLQTFHLFNTTKTDTSQIVLDNETVFNDINCNRLRLKNQPLLNDDKETNSLAFEGLIRIEFAAPDDGFGHRLYSRILPGIISHNARKYGSKHGIPNIPFIPVAKSVLVDYQLEHNEVLKTGKHNEDSHTIHLIHVYPFGFDAVYPEKENTDIYLVPQLAEESNLVIGLKDVDPGQELSILFQLEEMSFHHTAHQAETIHWTYLVENRWIPFKEGNILVDSTNHFVSSGIVRFKLPRDITVGNTILNPELFWIKASSNGHTAGSRVIGIFTQGCMAVRDMSKDAATDAINILPPGSIKGFSRQLPDIVNLWQFFSTIGGRQKEQTDDFRIRVSERLRHKDRLLTTLDISQMILDAFPNILMVKCFGRGVQENHIMQGKNVKIIVIPKERPDGRFISDEPKVSLALLLAIKKLITGRLSSFADPEVGNPVYEKIKVVCYVMLDKGRLNSNDGYYINLINENIKKFITPWLFDNSFELKIGGKIYISDILDYINKLPYVRYVSGFSVLHLYKSVNELTGESDTALADSSDITRNRSEYIEASRPDAILISSSSHIIRILNNQAYKEAVQSGIGDLRIGDELPVLNRGATNSTDSGGAMDDEDKLNFKFNIKS